MSSLQLPCCDRFSEREGDYFTHVSMQSSNGCTIVSFGYKPIGNPYQKRKFNNLDILYLQYNDCPNIY
jgi:hypothetical protein